MTDMDTISEKTVLPLSLVATIVGVVVSLTAGVAVQQYRASVNTERIDKLEARASAHEARMSVDEIKAERIDVTVQTMAVAVERIDRNVDNVLRAVAIGTRGGGQPR